MARMLRLLSQTLEKLVYTILLSLIDKLQKVACSLDHRMMFVFESLELIFCKDLFGSQDFHQCIEVYILYQRALVLS